MTFEQYVDEWLKIKAEAARLKDQEMTMRTAIRESVRTHLGDKFKEGANTHKMADGRKITVTHKINRTVDDSQISVIREEYEALNDRPVEFDDLLKVKYELSISNYRKLEGRAAEIFSDMVTTKDGSPEVKVS